MMTIKIRVTMSKQTNHKSWSEEHRANHKAAMKKFHQEHPGAVKKWLNSSKKNLITHQYDSLLIGKLREKYHSLNSRCNNPDNPGYKWYGGRGIQNNFTSLIDFLNYVILEMCITALEQIDGLEIDRIDNDGNYEPGNIRFVTPQVNKNNQRRGNQYTVDMRN